jgi:hypothetical protein
MNVHTTGDSMKKGAAAIHRSYHALDAVGGSTVSKIASAGALRDALTPFSGSDAATIGSCVDARWIEGLAPDDVYQVPPVVDRRTKEGKAAHAEWLESRRDDLYEFERTPHECVERVEATVRALRAHRRAEILRAKSNAQSQMQWTETLADGRQIPCKGLADLVPRVANGVVHLVDLKTTGLSVDPRKVRYTVRDRGYAYQLAHYRRGLRSIGYRVDACLLLFAQSTPPHGVELFLLDPVDLDSAEWDLTERVYPLIADLRAGVELYHGHGDLAADGLEPIHTLDGVIQ